MGRGKTLHRVQDSREVTREGVLYFQKVGCLICTSLGLHILCCLPPTHPTPMLLHRYNEFHDLYEKLRKAFPSEASGMKFPGKRIIGNNFDPDFIKLRREALHDFTIRLMKVWHS